jgi:hypothetical protein
MVVMTIQVERTDSMTVSYELVPFHEHPILTVREGDLIIVPLKPMVDALGVSWHGQLERLKRHPVLSKGIRVTRIPSPGGMQETTGLALDMVPGFLTTIETSRIKDLDVRARVELFQMEAFQVLFEHFFGGRTAATQIEASDRAARRRELPGLLERLERSRHGESQRILHELVVRACEAEEIVPPALEAYQVVGRDDEIAASIVLQIDALVERQPDLNHHRDSYKIGVRMKDLAAAGLVVPRGLLPALRRHPRFLLDGSVNKRGGGHVHCWVFTRA